MDFVFNNPLANLYGPYFLALYGIFIGSVTAAIWLARRASDRTDRLPAPMIPNELDPFEPAFLRGGENELARTAVFSLMQKGLLLIDGSGKTTRLRRTNENAGRLSEIERDTLEWVGSEREPAELFRAGGLTAELARHANRYRAQLENRQLLTGAAQSNGFRPYRIAGLLAIIGLGAYKLVAALYHGRSNVILLVILAVLGVVAAALAGKMPRVTKLGTTYLERLRLAFEPVRGSLPAAPANAAGSAGVDPLLLAVGIFGTGALAGTAYGYYNDAFKKSENASGCGAGCGTCSTSSCSSGDSGSSCGGGGCGGCGGGD